MSALGVGWLLGALLSRRLSQLTHQGRLVIGVTALDGICLITLPWIPGEPALLAFMLAFGVTDGILMVIVLTVLQRLPPRHLRGRVLGLLSFALFATYPISTAFAGVILSRDPVSLFFHLTGSGVCVVALIGLASASVRQAKSLPAVADAPVPDERTGVPT
jgi:predicted MFS family arabinose efflux permease